MTAPPSAQTFRVITESVHPGAGDAPGRLTVDTAGGCRWIVGLDESDRGVTATGIAHLVDAAQRNRGPRAVTASWMLRGGQPT
jgi:hypothetical protein